MKKQKEFMKLALNEAIKAGENNEVPVGAILLDKGENIICSAYNQVIKLADPTAHAEILLLRKAGSIISNYRLLGTTLYVTIEPCPMCMGAIMHARVERVVFGAYDLKWGAAGSLYNFAEDNRLNHRLEITGGICEEECRAVIQAFFRSRRNKKIE